MMSTSAASQGFICKLKDRKEVAEGTMAFRFEKPSGWTFKAGQYHGFFRRAENSAVILWDARVVEPDADASDAGAVDDWLHAPRHV